MSGGLLEKAKQASGDSGGDDVAAAAEEVIATTLEPVPSTPPFGLNDSLALKVGLGTFVLGIGGILFMSKQEGLGFAALALLLISGYMFSVYVKFGMNSGLALRPTQWSAIIVGILLLSSGAWAMGMEPASSGILLTNGEVHEDDNTVTLMLRHSSGSLFGGSWDGGDVAVSVSQDDAVTWSGTVNVLMNQEDMVGKYGLITLQISDFYAASAIQIDGFTSLGLVNTVEHPYTVSVTLDGNTESQVLPTLELSRNVDDIDEEAYGQVSDTGCDSGYTSCVDYVELRGWVGMGVESADEDTTPVRVRGDYTLDMAFGIDDEGTTMSVDVSGTEAQWAAGDCSAGTMDIAVDTSGFMFMCNGANNFDADLVLSDSSGDREYGCYTLTVSATQDGEIVATSSSHYMFDENQDSDNSGTYKWETFESTESC